MGHSVRGSPSACRSCDAVEGVTLNQTQLLRRGRVEHVSSTGASRLISIAPTFSSTTRQALTRLTVLTTLTLAEREKVVRGKNGSYWIVKDRQQSRMPILRYCSNLIQISSPRTKHAQLTFRWLIFLLTTSVQGAQLTTTTVQTVPRSRDSCSLANFQTSFLESVCVLNIGYKHNS